MTQPRPKDLIWAAGTTAEADRANGRVVQALETWIKAGKRKAVLAVLQGWTPADVLGAMLRMRPKRARRLFEWLPEDASLRVLVDIDPDLRGVLYDAATRDKFRRFVSKISRDHAIDVLEVLPPETIEDLISARTDADQIRAVLLADDDSAAAHMRHSMLTASLGWRIGDVLADLQQRSAEIERLDMIFVVDSDGQLAGYLRVRDLLLNPADTLVADILHPDPVTIREEDDQEHALRLAEERDAAIIAVIDAEGRLMGGIARPELAEIAQEEAEEDMLKLGGVSPETTQFDGPLQIVKRRLPWLLGGLFGGSVAAAAIVSYEDALAETALLASFIPVVLATAGNAGIQASTVSVQILTSGAEWRGDLWSRVTRELIGALLNGLAVGLAVACLVMLADLFLTIDRPIWLALTSIVALTIVTVIAAAVGSLVPFALRAMSLDPAAATGIFITTSNDVFGVLAFFTVAQWLYL